MDRPPIRPLTATKGVCMLVYGVPGSGKTVFVGTGPKTLIIRPPTDHTESAAAFSSDADELVVNGWAEMLEAHRFLQQGGWKEYEWVWLDSISLVQDTTLDDVWLDTLARRPDRAAYGLDQGEYGRNMERLQRWMRDMHSLVDLGQINFGVTAHPFEWYDPVAEEDVWAPWVQGKQMSEKICGYMHLIAYLEAKERDEKPTRRRLMTAAKGFIGKDQLGIPKVINDPTMPKVISAIRKARRGAKAPAKKPVKRTVRKRTR